MKRLTLRIICFLASIVFVSVWVVLREKASSGEYYNNPDVLLLIVSFIFAFLGSTTLNLAVSNFRELPFRDYILPLLLVFGITFAPVLRAFLQ